jgi:type I restriction enzyme S subunit
MEVRPGYKRTEVGVIPEEWDTKALQDLTDPARPIGYGIVQTGKSVFNGVRCVRVVDIVAGRIDPEQLITTSQEISQAYKRTSLRENDLVIALRGKIGAVAVIGKELAGANLTRGVAVLSASDNIRYDYLSHYLSSTVGKTTIEKNLNGSALQEIPIAALRKIPVIVPPIPEQRAIAVALIDADALLGGLERLIAKKRDLKQAAMQQLLTGQTRLPGFSGEWEETTLGELATFLSGGTPSRSNDDYWIGDIPWISATSLRCFEIWRSDSNVTKEAVTAGSKMAPVGSSLLLVRGSALHKEILCGLVTKPVCFNQDVKALVPHPQVVPRFLTIFVKGTAEEFLKLVSSAGNTAGVLDTKLLKAFAIKLPKLNEQTAIAAVLSDMDAELSALVARRDKTRDLKQAMMQELLTGRTRLV